MVPPNIPQKSFVPQSDHGIDARGSPRGDVARCQPDNCQQGAHSEKCNRIARLDSVKKAAQRTRHAHRSNDSENYSESNQRQRLCSHQPEDVSVLRAKGCTDSNLARAPRYFIRQQAIQPDARKRQSQQSKQARKARQQPFVEEQSFDSFRLCSNVEQREIIVEIAHDLAYTRKQGPGIYRRPQCEVCCVLLQGNIGSGRDLIAQAGVLCVSHYSNDFVLCALWVVAAKMRARFSRNFLTNDRLTTATFRFDSESSRVNVRPVITGILIVEKNSGPTASICVSTVDLSIRPSILMSSVHNPPSSSVSDE